LPWHSRIPCDTIIYLWRFEPGSQNGKPVDVQIIVSIPFKLPHDPALRQNNYYGK
jgi:hypothetical protein